MARKITIAEYNRLVKQHNDQQKRNLERYNREVKKHNDAINRNIDSYNRQVRQYNDQQRRQRQALNSAITNFNHARNTVITRNYYTLETVQNLEKSYNELENYTDIHNSNSSLLIDYPLQETNNSIQLYNAVNGIDNGEYLNPSLLQHTEIEERLYKVSMEIGKRWQGALYSLNPNNPDAARHFCTSVREVFIQLIEHKAQDHEVLATFPNCEMHNGKPNRRTKIKYILAKNALSIHQLENFVSNDVEDILTLFRTLNDGTHGSAGTFDVQQLLKIKKRAEDAIIFITTFN